MKVKPLLMSKFKMLMYLLFVLSAFCIVKWNLIIYSKINRSQNVPELDVCS